jgi:hypothetical protein
LVANGKQELKFAKVQAGDPARQPPGVNRSCFAFLFSAVMPTGSPRYPFEG